MAEPLKIPGPRRDPRASLFFALWRLAAIGVAVLLAVFTLIQRIRLGHALPVSGWVAITMLTLQENQAGYGWLRQYRPVQQVGKSFELYYIP